LRQAQFLAALANLLRRQQSGGAAESGADLLVGLVVDKLRKSFSEDYVHENRPKWPKSELGCNECNQSEK